MGFAESLGAFSARFDSLHILVFSALIVLSILLAYLLMHDGEEKKRMTAQKKVKQADPQTAKPAVNRQAVSAAAPVKEPESPKKPEPVKQSEQKPEFVKKPDPLKKPEPVKKPEPPKKLSRKEQKALEKAAKEKAKAAAIEAKTKKKTVPVQTNVPVAPEVSPSPQTPEEMARRLESLLSKEENVSAVTIGLPRDAQPLTGSIDAAALNAAETKGAEEAKAFEMNSAETKKAEPEAETVPVSLVEEKQPAVAVNTVSSPEVRPDVSAHKPVEEPKPPVKQPVKPAEPEKKDKKSKKNDKKNDAQAEPAPVNTFAFARGLEASADDVQLSSRQRKKMERAEEEARKREEERLRKEEKKKKGFSLFSKKHEEESSSDDDFWDEEYMGEEIPDSLAGFGFTAAPAVKDSTNYFEPSSEQSELVVGGDNTLNPVDSFGLEIGLNPSDANSLGISNVGFGSLETNSLGGSGSSEPVSLVGFDEDKKDDSGNDKPMTFGL